MSDLFENQILESRTAGGGHLVAPVINEHQLRAAAGITMALGAVAFAYAYFEHRYWALQVVSCFVCAEFLVRVTFGISHSPIGLLAGWMTRRQPPHWVSAKPRRFAWRLGLAMTGFLAIIINGGIRGWLPGSICLAFITLLWLESVLALCLGGEVHALMVRHGWARQDEAYQACAVTSRRAP